MNRNTLARTVQAHRNPFALRPRVGMFALLACLPCAVHAQVAAGKPAGVGPGFRDYDVISVKPDKSGTNNMSVETHDITFRAENVSVKMLLANASGIRDSLITGLPGWANSMRWDINAKILDADPTLKDRKLTEEQGTAEWRAHTLQILTDRFHLKTHVETVNGPIYDMVVAKGGSKLKPADPAEESKGGMRIHNQQLTATYLPASSLTEFLANETGRNVVDKTGLTGHYDMELRWTREDQAGSATDTGATDKPPTLFTALEEQLGLKLVPSKGPVTTLVVDSIDMPAED